MYFAANHKFMRKLCCQALFSNMTPNCMLACSHTRIQDPTLCIYAAIHATTSLHQAALTLRHLLDLDMHNPGLIHTPLFLPLRLPSQHILRHLPHLALLIHKLLP